MAYGAGEDVAQILARADARLAAVGDVIRSLDLIGRWSAVGRPTVAGSVAYGLIAEPDIDMEIYCRAPRVEEGFAVVSRLALEPGVRKVRFSSELEGPDPGLYFQLRYRAPAAGTATEWKVDMWLLADDYSGPRSAGLVEPMRRVLTTETRAAHGSAGLAVWRPHPAPG